MKLFKKNNFVIIALLSSISIFSQNLRVSHFRADTNDGKPKIKLVLSFGAGIAFRNNQDSDPLNNFQSKSSFQLAGLIPLGKFTGLRLDAGYSGWFRDEFKNDWYDSNLSVRNYDKYGSQNMHYYSVKTDFVIGRFDSKNSFWFYFTIGLGINFLREDSFVFERISGRTFTARDSLFNYLLVTSSWAVLSAGSSLGYKLSKQFGVYAEIQLNNSIHGGFSFLGKNDKSYLPIRVGITYTIY